MAVFECGFVVGLDSGLEIAPARSESRCWSFRASWLDELTGLDGLHVLDWRQGRNLLDDDLNGLDEFLSGRHLDGGDGIWS